MGNSVEFLKNTSPRGKRYVDGVGAIGVHRGKFNVIFDPLDNICHRKIHPGIDEIDNNLHSVRLSNYLRKTRAHAKHLKEPFTQSIPYIGVREA